MPPTNLTIKNERNNKILLLKKAHRLSAFSYLKLANYMFTTRTFAGFQFQRKSEIKLSLASHFSVHSTRQPCHCDFVRNHKITFTSYQFINCNLSFRTVFFFF